MKRWKWVTLGEIAEKIGSGLTPRGGDSTYRSSGVPFIRSQNVHLNRFERTGLAYISDQQDSEMIDSRVLPGDVLLNITGASIGRVCTPPSELCPANVNQHVCIIRTNGRVSSRFLAFFLATPGFQSFIANSQSGATRQALTKGQIEEFRVPQPEEEIQQRVVAILERADRLRRLRRYGLEMCADFLLMSFVRDFGDPLANPMNWETEPLDDLCVLVRGSSPRPQGDPRFFKGPVPRLMIADITRDGLYVIPKIDSLTKQGAERSRPMDRGSAVMAVSGDVGLPAILGCDACIHDGFVGFRELSAKLLPIYFYFVLKIRQKWNKALATGAIWQNLTTDQVKEWRIPIPPRTKQQQFAELVVRYDRFELIHRESLRQAEHLFKTLLHRAFTSGF